MKTEIKTITPEMAERMLEKNTTNNRVLNHNNITFYAMTMGAGEWLLNGESIKFGKSGRLLDGQHRLMAVVKSGVPIQMLVIYDVDDSSFVTIDTGKSRNPSDVFRIMDIKNGTSVSSGISLYLLLKGSVVLSASGSKIRKISNKDILEEYKLNPEYYQELHSLSDTLWHKSFRIVRKSEYFAFTAIYELYHGKRIYSFWTDFLEKKGVAGLLYNKLMLEKVGKRALPKHERLALFIKAINYFLENKNIKLLKYSADEQTPKILKTKVAQSNGVTEIPELVY